MSVLQSIFSDLSSLAGIAAFITWWVATFLGVQLSRYRHEPEMPVHKRRLEVSVLVFLGLCGAAIALRLVAAGLGRQ